MFRFTITTLNDSGHGSVQRLSDFTLPLAGTVTGTVTDTDGDSWFYAELIAPVTYTAPAIGAAAGPPVRPVTDVVLRPHYLDEQPSPGMTAFPMDFAVVLDPAMRNSRVIDLNRVDFIAVVEVDDAGPEVEIVPVPGEEQTPAQPAVNGAARAVQTPPAAPPVSAPAAQPAPVPAPGSSTPAAAAPSSTGPSHSSRGRAASTSVLSRPLIRPYLGPYLGPYLAPL